MAPCLLSSLSQLYLSHSAAELLQTIEDKCVPFPAKHILGFHSASTVNHNAKQVLFTLQLTYWLFYQRARTLPDFLKFYVLTETCEHIGDHYLSLTPYPTQVAFYRFSLSKNFHLTPHASVCHHSLLPTVPLPETCRRIWINNYHVVL